MARQAGGSRYARGVVAENARVIGGNAGITRGIAHALLEASL